MDPLELWTQLNARFANLTSLNSGQREAVNRIIEEQTGIGGGLDELATTARVIRQHPDASISQQDRLIRQSTESTALRVDESRGSGAGTEISQGVLTGLHGASLGSLDEIVGAISAIPALVPGGQSPGEAFTKGRGQFNAEIADFSNRNPKTALGLQIGGGLASGVGAPVALGALSGGGKLATFLKGLGVATGEGAFAGAASAEPGSRGAGAAGGAALGAVFGTAGPAISSTARAVKGGTKGLFNLIKRTLQGTKKARPSATSIETGVEGANALAEEILRPDTNFNPETLFGNEFVSGSIRRQRAREPKFTLADHPVFTDLIDDADRIIASTSVGERLGASAGINLAEEVAGQAGVAAISPKLGLAKIVGSRLLRGRSQREILKTRAVAKWLSDKGNSTDPKEIDEVLSFIQEALRGAPTPGRPSIGAGFTGPAVQQLVESLDQ